MCSGPICLCGPMSDPFPPSNPFHSKPILCHTNSKCKVSPSVSSSLLPLGLCKCCFLCPEDIYSAPSHPDKFLCLQDSAQMSLPLGRSPLGPLELSSLCNSTLYSEDLSHHHSPWARIPAAPSLPLPRPSIPKHHPSCPWDLLSVPIALLDACPSLLPGFQPPISLLWSVSHSTPREVFLGPKLTPPFPCS